MDYEKQYLKYKNKYLSLKKLASQRGGAAPTGPQTPEQKAEIDRINERCIGKMAKLESQLSTLQTNLQSKETVKTLELEKLKEKLKYNTGITVSQTAGAQPNITTPPATTNYDHASAVTAAHEKCSQSLEHLENQRESIEETHATMMRGIEAQISATDERLRMIAESINKAK